MTSLLPSEIGAERSVLGAALLGHRELTLELLSEVSAAEFYDPTHAAIWTAIVEVTAAGAAADLVTVEARMRASGTFAHLAHRDGSGYLIDLSLLRVVEV